MAYKTSFRPLERLGRDGWRRMDDCEGEPDARSAADASVSAGKATGRDRRLNRSRPVNRVADSSESLLLRFASLGGEAEFIFRYLKSLQRLPRPAFAG